jgi:hypothetical protein
MIKFLAIGITLYYITKNKELASNIIGGLLILSFGLTIIGVTTLTNIALITYMLTLGAALFLVLAKRIKHTSRSLLVLFLTLSIISGFPLFLNLPNYVIFIYAAIATILLYAYFQLKHRSVNILVITSIPLIDALRTLAQLVN